MRADSLTKRPRAAPAPLRLSRCLHCHTSGALSATLLTLLAQLPKSCCAVRSDDLLGLGQGNWVGDCVHAAGHDRRRVRGGGCGCGGARIAGHVGRL